MEATLFFQAEMAEGETHPIAGGKAAVFSSRPPGKQTPNEDAAALIPVNGRTGVLVVADGMGGMPVGEQASCLAIGELLGAIREASPDEPSRPRSTLRALPAARLPGPGPARPVVPGCRCDPSRRAKALPMFRAPREGNRPEPRPPAGNRRPQAPTALRRA